MFALTHCAACAEPLAHNAPRCVRCRTRYCNAKAVTILEDVCQTARQVFGADHPFTKGLV